MCVNVSVIYGDESSIPLVCKMGVVVLNISVLCRFDPLCSQVEIITIEVMHTEYLQGKNPFSFILKLKSCPV